MKTEPESAWEDASGTLHIPNNKKNYIPRFWKTNILAKDLKNKESYMAAEAFTYCQALKS